MYDTLFSALEDVEEGLTSGKIGRNDYQTAVDLLIPTDVSAEGEARIQEYKNNVLSRFMTMDGENNVTAWGA